MNLLQRIERLEARVPSAPAADQISPAAVERLRRRLEALRKEAAVEQARDEEEERRLSPLKLCQVRLARAKADEASAKKSFEDLDRRAADDYRSEWWLSSARLRLKASIFYRAELESKLRELEANSTTLNKGAG